MRGYLLFVVLALAQSSAFVARSPSKHVAKQLRSGSVPSSDTKLTRKPPVVRSRDQRLPKIASSKNIPAEVAYGVLKILRVPLVLFTGSIIAVAAVLGTSVAVCGFAAVDTMLKVCPSPKKDCNLKLSADHQLKYSKLTSSTSATVCCLCTGKAAALVAAQIAHDPLLFTDAMYDSSSSSSAH
eukprot:6733-Heterococcus_DN1.PRE.3